MRTSVDGYRVVLLVSGAAYGLAYGDSVSVRGRVARSERERLLSSRVDGRVNAVRGGIVRLHGHAGNPARRHLLWPMHARIRVALVRNLGADAALPLALLLGDRSKVAPSSRAAFQRLGVSHLLALSGLHLGVLIAVVWIVCRRLGLRSPLWIMPPVLLYVMMVGSIASLQRATWMAASVVVAASLRRPPVLLAGLGNAAFIMLLIEPRYLWSVSFQLSLVATAAVLAGLAPLRLVAVGRVRRVLVGAATTLWIGVAATLALLPLQLAYFDGLVVAGPLVTLLLTPAVAAALIMSPFIATMASVAGPDSVAWFGFVCGLLLTFVEWLAQHAPAPFEVTLLSPLVYWTALAGMFAARSHGVRLVVAILGVTAFGCG